MIKLSTATFARAISKAQTVRPRVECADTDETDFTFYVERSARTGAFAVVDLWHRGGVLWSSCDCPAGSDPRWPLPCYHVAAAALALGLLPAALPLGAVADPAPEGAAARQVPAPLVPVAELAPIAPPAHSLGPAMVSTPAGAFITEARWSRMSAAVSLFGRRIRGVCARRGWLVGASRA